MGIQSDNQGELPSTGINDEPDDHHSFGGIWTLIKLEALEKYLHSFSTALKNKGFQRIYIDAFAGTGRCDITVHGKKASIDGSARRALACDPPYQKYWFIDRSPKKLDALKALEVEFPGKSIELIHDDANSALKKLCGQYRWKSERAVLFLDPYGMNVEWSTLEAIANTKAIDVWYLFPYSGLYRQAAKDADAMDADKQAAITRLLGTDDWRKEFYVQSPQADLFGGSPGDVRDADHQQMLDFVSKRLKGLFPAVTAPKILFQRGDPLNPSGAPLFALYFAVSNPKASELALRIANGVLSSL